MKVTVGIDVGQSQDPTAIAVVEREWRSRPPHPETGEERAPLDHYNVRFLRTLGLNIPYPSIANTLKGLIDRVNERVAGASLDYVRGELQQVDWPSVTVYVDATGVGQPMLDLLTFAGLSVTGVYFTHGDRRVVQIDAETEIRRIILGKAYMVARLQALLQTRRLHLPETPPSRVLSRELLNYQIRVDQNANDRYGAFKVGTHDDLVTALGLCVQEPVRGVSVGASSPGYTPEAIPEWASAPGDAALPDLSPWGMSAAGRAPLGSRLDEYRRYT